MHYVSTFDPSAMRTPSCYEKRSAGFSRCTLVDHTTSPASVHMGVGICELQPGGYILPHLHSFEESFILLDGEALIHVNGNDYKLASGHYGLIHVEKVHAWRNVGSQPVLWLEMQSPQPLPADYGRDTFFVKGDAPTAGIMPDKSQLKEHLLGFFDESQLPQPGSKAEMEGFNPTTGVAIKMFVDRSFGAHHESLFLIQYMPGAKIAPHDHTFEESYYIVSGEVEAVLDGKRYRVGPGGIVWTSVGCIHSFANAGDVPVQWIETQAPLPPAQNVFRFEKDYAKFIEEEPPVS